MGRYEIQVLDSYGNPSHADGQAGAIYGQWPPLVNATRPPRQWQTYDIILEAPRFEAPKSPGLLLSPYSGTASRSRITGKGRPFTVLWRTMFRNRRRIQWCCRTTEIRCGTGISGSAASADTASPKNNYRPTLPAWPGRV